MTTHLQNMQYFNNNNKKGLHDMDERKKKKLEKGSTLKFWLNSSAKAYIIHDSDLGASRLRILHKPYFTCTDLTNV